jgi:hypothetical protein
LGEKSVLKRLCADKGGISPFIASVIIVAILILIGIAIAYWLSGAAGSYAKEELKIVSVYAESTSVGWRIIIQVKNTGSAEAAISDILLNQKSCADYAGEPWRLSLESNGAPVADLRKINIVLKAGEEKKLVITTRDVEPFTYGVILRVQLRSASGQEPPLKEVTLK